VPTLSSPTTTVACPLASTGAVSAGPFSLTMKVTVPVGAGPPGWSAVTVAVRVMDSPQTAGLGEAVSVVVVSPWPTVWLAVPDEPAKFASPP
jgi:hypothetical protein